MVNWRRAETADKKERDEKEEVGRLERSQSRERQRKSRKEESRGCKSPDVLSWSQDFFVVMIDSKTSLLCYSKVFIFCLATLLETAAKVKISAQKVRGTWELGRTWRTLNSKLEKKITSLRLRP